MPSFSALQGFLQAPSPNAPRPRQQPQDRVEGLSDPELDFARQIREFGGGNPVAEGILVGLLRRRGIQVRTEEQILLDRRQAALQRDELGRRERQNKTRNMIGLLLDEAEAPAKDILMQFANQDGVTDPDVLSGIESLGGLTLNQFISRTAGGVQLDESLISNPGNITKASRVLANALGAPDLTVSRSDLLDFDLTKSRATVTTQERGLERAQAQRKFGEEAVKLSEQSAEFVEGEGPVAENLAQTIEAFEDNPEGQNFDLEPSLFGDDFDTLGGAVRFTNAIDTFVSGVERVGADIGSQSLDLMKTEFFQDGVLPELKKRVAIDDAGVATPTDDVSAQYLKLLQDLADKGGLGMREMFSQIGLVEARAVDRTSVDQFLRAAKAGLEADVRSAEAP